MRKTLLVAAACGALMVASAGTADAGLFGNAKVQNAAYNFWNPSSTVGVNAFRPKGTEKLTQTANKVIYALFRVSNFTYLFGLR